MYACCQSTHSAVEAMIGALAKMPKGKGAANVERITLETHRPGMSNPHPATTLAAKFAFEHVLATAHVHGHASADAFSAETLARPEIARLRERAVVAGDAGVVLHLLDLVGPPLDQHAVGRVARLGPRPRLPARVEAHRRKNDQIGRAHV